MQILPHVVLDNEVLNRNRISKDHLNSYEEFLIGAVWQRRAGGQCIKKRATIVQGAVCCILSYLRFF